MPSEEEHQRVRAERPENPAFRELPAGLPKVEFDPDAMRRRLTEEMRRRQERKP